MRLLCLGIQVFFQASDYSKLFRISLSISGDLTLGHNTLTPMPYSMPNQKQFGFCLKTRDLEEWCWFPLGFRHCVYIYICTYCEEKENNNVRAPRKVHVLWFPLSENPPNRFIQTIEPPEEEKKRRRKEEEEENKPRGFSPCVLLPGQPATHFGVPSTRFRSSRHSSR